MSVSVRLCRKGLKIRGFTRGCVRVCPCLIVQVGVSVGVTDVIDTYSLLSPFAGILDASSTVEMDSAGGRANEQHCQWAYWCCHIGQGLEQTTDDANASWFSDAINGWDLFSIYTGTCCEGEEEPGDKVGVVNTPNSSVV